MRSNALCACQHLNLRNAFFVSSKYKRKLFTRIENQGAKKVTLVILRKHKIFLHRCTARDCAVRALHRCIARDCAVRALHRCIARDCAVRALHRCIARDCAVRALHRCTARDCAVRALHRCIARDCAVRALHRGAARDRAVRAAVVIPRQVRTQSFFSKNVSRVFDIRVFSSNLLPK